MIAIRPEASDPINPNKASSSSSSSPIRYEQERRDTTILYRAFHNKPTSSTTATTSSSSKVPVTIRQWAQALAQENDSILSRKLRLEFSQLIADAPFLAVFFETKGTTYTMSESEPFEFVLLRSKSLELFVKRRGGANPQAFAQHLDEHSNNNNSNNNSSSQQHLVVGKSNNKNNGKNPHAVAFRNLSGDALLIAPKPMMNEDLDSTSFSSSSSSSRSSMDYYAHVAEFCRHASHDQIDGFWKHVAIHYLKELSNKKNQPLWLSTCGTGVPWLHVRLDTHPKYYSHIPYKQVVVVGQTTIKTTTTTTTDQNEDNKVHRRTDTKEL